MKCLLPLLLLAAVCLASCNSTDTKLNKEIDAGLRTEIKQKNDSLILGLQTSSKAIFENIASKEFVKAIQAHTNNIWFMFRRGYGVPQYKVYDEFEVRGSTPFDLVELQSGKKGYTFMYTTKDKDSYVSILQFDYGNRESIGIAVIYTLLEGKWKITDLDAFTLSSYGKTPLDLYETAKKEEAEGHIIDAAYYANNAVQMLERYADTKYRFNDDKEIKLYSKTLETKVGETYKFPYVLENISTKPSVTGVLSRPGDNGLYYQISYETQISINDMPALEAEYEKIRAEVDKVFKLNLKGKETIFRATNIVKDRFGQELDTEVFDFFYKG
jgi:hypothetical protein